MTGALRSTARSPVAIALMGLLILVFLVLGVGGNGRFPDLFRVARADSVVTAGSHAMSANDYRRIFDQQKQKLEQQNGSQQFTNLFLAQNGFDQQLLSAIAQDESLADLLSRLGVTPSPQLIDEQIKKLPFAFDRVTGRFSEAQFTQALAAQGLTVAQAQSEIADELAQRHFVTAMAGAFRAPRIFAAVDAVAALEARDVSYFVLNPQVVPRPVPPTDAQLQTFMQQHASQLTLPERRTVSLVRFSAAALTPTVSITPAEVAKEFEARKGTLSTPETRTVVQVPVRTAADGASAAARLKQGQDANLVARSLGVQPITYTDKPQSGIADRKLAGVAFQMTAGESRGPVEGDLGLAVLKVVKITPGKPSTLETARGKIEADLKQKAARDKAYKMSQDFDDARTGGANLQAAAAKAGASVETIGPFTADGKDLQGKAIPNLPEKMVKSAFAKRPGEEPDLEDAGSGEYYALKVDKVSPAAVPSLAEAKPQLTAAYLQSAFMDSLRAKADGLVDQLKAGKPISEVAASVGSHPQTLIGLRRIDAAKYQSLGQSFLQGVFGVKPGTAFPVGAPNGVHIAKVDQARPGNLRAVADLDNGIRGRIGQAYATDLLAAVKAAAQREEKAQVNLNLARQAIGVDPGAVGARGGGSAK